MDEDIVFPPPFTVRHLLPGLDPAREAAMAAARGELGAADVLWNAEAGRLRLALVLEPETPEPPLAALVDVMQTAVVRALAALLPAQVAVAVASGGRIMVNAGEIARVLLRWPPGWAERRKAMNDAAGKSAKGRSAHTGALPPWLLLCLDLHLHRTTGREGGETPDIAVLSEESGAPIVAEALVAEVLSHFLLALHAWQDGGQTALAAMRKGF